MKQHYKHLEKYSPPTRLDKESHGTLWAHITDEGERELYIQVNQDKEASPTWIKYGDFLATAFKTHLDSELFIERCLKLYAGIYQSPTAMVNKIIQDR